MKVLQLIDSLNVGGAERLAVTYANALVTNSEGSFLCTTRKEGPLLAQLVSEVGYLHLARTKVLDKNAVTTLVQFIKQHNIDVIHAHGTSFLFAFMIKKRVPAMKLIWHIHSGNLPNTSRSKKLIIRYCMSSIDAVICVNTALKEWIQAKYKKATAVYLRNFVSFENKVDEQRALHLPGAKDRRVVCLANLRQPKDHLTLIKAFEKVVVEVPDAQLFLLGSDIKDAYSDSVKSLITASQLDENVHILGLQSSPEDYLYQCKVGVLSSTSEGLPMSLLEYGRAGLTPVVTNVGQCAQVVGDTGYVVPSQDVNALSKALVSALKSEETISFKEKIKREYSQQVVISNLLEVYKMTLKIS